MLPVLGALVAQTARYVVIAAVQLGIFAFIEKWILPMINKCIVELMTHLNIPEETAKDIMANEVLKAGESIGIFAATMKTKIPLKVASLLGFTTKGWSKRAIGTGILTKLEQKSASGLLSKSGTLIISKLEAPTAIEAAKATVKGFAPAYKIVLNTLGVGFVGFIAVNNFIDFGNWNSGAYQKTMQKVIETISFGLLVPDKKYEKPTVVSDANFETVYNAYKLAGATTIINNWEKTEVPFSRENLIDLLDRIASQLLLTGETASVKNVMQASTLFVIVPGGTTEQTTTPAVTPTTTPAVNKVFTGVVSQGTLGNPDAFIARPTDLIDDISELQISAQNNLVSFIVALPGRIVYEIKIVSSVTSKDGFVTRGTTQKIISGYFANGTPKYKTVTNKFAQLNVYVLTSKGIKSKIDTVNLGPVNSATFNPSGQEIQFAEQYIQQNLTTNDVSEISTIVTPTDVTVQTGGQTTQIDNSTPKGSDGLPVENAWIYYRRYINGYWNYTDLPFFMNYLPTYEIITKSQFIEGLQEHLRQAEKMVAEKDAGTYIPQAGITWDRKQVNELKARIADVLARGKIEIPKTAPTIPTVNVAPTSNNPNRCLASTISGYYGGIIPPQALLAERAKMYEAWGLGPAAYYIGTAEQNNKWLAEAKRRSGC
jgi:hypothetical protein